MTSKKDKPSPPRTTSKITPKPESEPKKLIRFDFPPGATPEEIADAINRLRKEHGSED